MNSSGLVPCQYFCATKRWRRIGLFLISTDRAILSDVPHVRKIPERSPRHPQPGVLPDDLYDYTEAQLWPRIGRPVKHDLADWIVSDEWPERVPVTQTEVDLFEVWFGDLFDELFGPDR